MVEKFSKKDAEKGHFNNQMEFRKESKEKELLKDPLSLQIRRLFALVKKEFFQIIRDPSSILISIVLPLLLLFIYGFGVSLDLNHLRLGVVLEDNAPDAVSFVQGLTGSPYFDVTMARDRRELFDAVERGAIRGFVVIPSYFSAFRGRPDSVAPIQVIADGSEPNTANFVQNYVRGAYQIWLQQQVINSKLRGLPPVTSNARFWYNEELQSRNFLIPGSVALIMTLIGTLLTALVVAREWETGTMESLMATPVRIEELVFGKVIPYFTLGMISLTLCVIVAVFGYDVPLRGSVWVLYLASALFLLCALSIGLLISTTSKNQIIASQLAIVSAFLPAYMLSGFIFEISSMPEWIQWLTYVIPARYYVTILQTIFLVGNVWSLIFWNAVPLLLITTVVFILTARKTVKRLD